MAPRPFWKVKPPWSEPIISSVRASRLVAIFKGRDHIVPDAGRAIQRDCFGRRIVSRRQVGLQAMGQGIKRRSPQSSFFGSPKVSSGSQYGAFGDQMGAEEPELAPILKRNQCGTSDFGAGARCWFGMAITGATFAVIACIPPSMSA